MLVSTYDTPGLAASLSMVGSTVYVSDGASGLQVIDVSDPTAPAAASTIALAGNAQHFDLQNGILYLPDGSAGLRVVRGQRPLHQYTLLRLRGQRQRRCRPRLVHL